MSAEVPKKLTADAVRESDVCVTMGCGDTCPVFPGKRYLDWQLDDPAGQGVGAVRPIRDEIRVLVERLITEIAPVWRRDGMYRPRGPSPKPSRTRRVAPCPAVPPRKR
jgi:hypothetical protein